MKWLLGAFRWFDFFGFWGVWNGSCRNNLSKFGNFFHCQPSCLSNLFVRETHSYQISCDFPHFLPKSFGGFFCFNFYC